MEDRVQIGFTVDREIKNFLEQLAELEHRSMTNYFEILIRREAESHGLIENNNRPKNNKVNVM